MVAQIKVNQRRRIYREAFCMSQAKKGDKSVIAQRDGGGKDVGERFRTEETHVCLWLIHIDLWQKPSQYDEVIIL